MTPVDGDLAYTEGTFIGYRGHYAGHAPEPAFWFGHGLGYSTWDYGQPVRIAGGPTPTVSVTMTNTGSRTSREVIQVYFRPDAADQPVRLVGWQAVTAAPSQSVTAEVRTDSRLWRRWDTAAGSWDVLPEGGLLLVARGLGDVRGTPALGPGSD